MKRIPALLLCSALSWSGAAYAQSGVIGTACADDIERSCSGISHIGGAVQLCLGEHISEVSTQCRTAMEAAGPANGRFGWGGKFNRPHYMGLRQIVATVQALGYTDIRDIDFEGGHYEVEATNSEGVKMELYVDSVTGKILRESREDD